VRRYSTITQAEIDATDAHRSTAFNDYYFSITDPIGERQTIFIEGNYLPERFQSLEANQTIRIGETGFGTGLTFLVACDQFLKHAPQNARLQWISTERYPMRQSDITKALGALPLTTDLRQLADDLCCVWPQLIPTCHRRLFKDGRITLDLHFGDSTDIVSNLSGMVDAWCLDGFSPDRNPESWTPALFQAIADHSHSGTTLSTFSAARIVRDGLSEAGFSVSKVPGFGGKRERLVAQFSGSAKQLVWAPKQHIGDMGRIAIVGGGLAGAWTAHAFAKRGMPVTVFEKESPASGASGNLQGITYAKLSIEATPNSLLQLQALAHLMTWFQMFPDNVWQHTGVLLLAQSPKEQAHQAKLLEALPKTDPLLVSVSQAEASGLCGQKLRFGGLHIPAGGWLNPKQCVNTLLDHPLIEVKSYHQIQSVESTDDGSMLQVTSSSDRMTSHPCDLVIWANAREASEFVQLPLPLKPVRGQVTTLKQTTDIKMPICGDAYVAPASNGVMTCGATYRPNSDDLTADPQDDQTNIDAINRLMDRPLWCQNDILDRRVSIRTATPDYAPVIGQIAGHDAWIELLERLRHDASFEPTEALPFIRGQYVLAGLGSRGTLTAPMAAEILVSQVLGEVLPVAEHARHALAPDRFLRRTLIRNLS
jgi:tRNA 5-methylaminomethyl-2-thiouridine biosynthesis bifunctional protein